MLQALFVPYVLDFKEPGGTSRGVMYHRKVWLVMLSDNADESVVGVGECAPLPGLSCDCADNYENMLQLVCKNISKYIADLSLLKDYPSIRFGLEMAWLDLRHKGQQRFFPSAFCGGSDGIRINGLIWMGDKQTMSKRIREKLRHNFTCLKLKIGAIDFESEIDLLSFLRKRFSPSVLEIRVDANGAFSVKDAPEKLKRLSRYGLHSIEQPIKARQWDNMAGICSSSPIPVALDEELIGLNDDTVRAEMLSIIKPQFIILKPSLLGGFAVADRWIELAEKYGCSWWATSALESNLGLNAIAQWVYTKNPHLPQGLGTGKVFTNNVPSALYLQNERLFLDVRRKQKSIIEFLRNLQNNNGSIVKR